MFYTYILWSESLGKFYTGHTQELSTRVEYHNSGNVSFTQRGIPWVLVHSESFPRRGEAMARERQIKGWKSAVAIRNLIDRDSPETVLLCVRDEAAEFGMVAGGRVDVLYLRDILHGHLQ